VLPLAVRLAPGPGHAAFRLPRLLPGVACWAFTYGTWNAAWAA